jgi:hypothetical protein
VGQAISIVGRESLRARLGGWWIGEEVVSHLWLNLR